MIKARFVSEKDGQPGMLLGITEENVRRLKDGQPIVVDLSQEMGINLKIILFYGVDGAALVKAIKPMIGPDTVRHGSPEDVD